MAVPFTCWVTPMPQMRQEPEKAGLAYQRAASAQLALFSWRQRLSCSSTSVSADVPRVTPGLVGVQVTAVDPYSPLAQELAPVVVPGDFVRVALTRDSTDAGTERFDQALSPEIGLNQLRNDSLSRDQIDHADMIDLDEQARQ